MSEWLSYSRKIIKLKSENDMLKAVLSFTWSAIVFGIVIGMIAIWAN